MTFINGANRVMQWKYIGGPWPPFLAVNTTSCAMKKLKQKQVPDEHLVFDNAKRERERERLDKTSVGHGDGVF